MYENMIIEIKSPNTGIQRMDIVEEWISKVEEQIEEISQKEKTRTRK